MRVHPIAHLPPDEWEMLAVDVAGRQIGDELQLRDPGVDLRRLAQPDTTSAAAGG